MSLSDRECHYQMFSRRYLCRLLIVCSCSTAPVLSPDITTLSKTSQSDPNPCVFCYRSRHSTGRGGIANLTSAPAPAIEHEHPHATHNHDGFESTGRGGAGNIRTRDGSREPREPEKERGRNGHGHGISALLDRVSRSRTRERASGEFDREKEGPGNPVKGPDVPTVAE